MNTYKRRARRSGKWLLTKHHGLWWVITPRGIARPCASWHIATSTINWTPRHNNHTGHKESGHVA